MSYVQMQRKRWRWQGWSIGRRYRALFLLLSFFTFFFGWGKGSTGSRRCRVGGVPTNHNRPSFLHHSALHTTLFVHTSDGTNTNDSESHQALLNKLHRMQVPSPLILWFEGYLSQRLQRVTQNGQCSTWLPVLSGGATGFNFGTLVVSNLH